MSAQRNSGELRPVGRRPAKSAEAFRTISEVAEQLDVPPHVLRFWETKFAQVRPLKRGGGRRYYRPEDIELLRRIRSLLYDEGYTIKGVQRLLREGGTGRREDLFDDDTEESAETPARLPIDQRRELESLLEDLVEMRDRLQRALSRGQQRERSESVEERPRPRARLAAS